MTTPNASELYRERALEVSNSTVRSDDQSGDELLEMEFAFASETPVERYFGSEELAVDSKAARLDRVGEGVVPVLADHDSRAVVGRVLSVTIGKDRIARARVRFSRSAAARDVVQDVVDGIRQGVSFGYRVHKMELIESGDAGERFRVVDWEVFEITIASIPADPSVGVHRSADRQRIDPQLRAARRGRKDRPMTMSYKQLAELPEDEFEEEIRGWADAKRLAATEAVRRIHIDKLCDAYKAPKELRSRAIEGDFDLEDMKRELRKLAGSRGAPLEPPKSGFFGTNEIPDEEFRGFSISRMIGAMVSNRRQDAGHEFEIVDHFSRGLDRVPRSSNTYSIPTEALVYGALSARAVGKTFGGGAGGSLVGTEHRGEMFIELLRNRIMTLALGVQTLVGLVGDQHIPKQATAGAVEWVGEGEGTGSPGEPAYTGLTMTPKTVRGRVDLTRKMVLQASPASDALISDELLRVVMLEVDRVILNGSGSANQPLGILNSPGIGVPSYDETSGTSEYVSLVNAMTTVADANVEDEKSAFLTSTGIRGRLMARFQDPGSGLTVWKPGSEPGRGTIAGYAAATSNNVPRDLGAGNDEHAIIAGDWSSILLGLWSGVDIKPDEVTLGDSGGLVLRVFQDVDVLLRRPEAFAVMSVNPSA